MSRSRYNHYRDMTNWKPFHHDAAGLDKSMGQFHGNANSRPPMSDTQNMTVGVSFGEARQAGFEWSGTRDRCSGLGGRSFPPHLLSPPVQPSRHSNVVLSLTLPDSSAYIFGRDVNLLWKHGILAEKMPTGAPAAEQGTELNVEEGRISIIAWGWVDQVRTRPPPSAPFRLPTTIARALASRPLSASTACTAPAAKQYDELDEFLQNDGPSDDAPREGPARGDGGSFVNHGRGPDRSGGRGGYHHDQRRGGGGGGGGHQDRRDDRRYHHADERGDGRYRDDRHHHHHHRRDDDRHARGGGGGGPRYHGGRR
jgi:hypothetical protein